MRNVSGVIVGVCSAATLTVAARSAEAAATCSFDPVAGVMVVEFTGQTTVRPQLARIMVDNVPCGAATLTTVDTILITGSGNLDFNMKAQPFAPGRTPEQNGVSEIEVDIQITGGAVRFFLDSTSNELDLDGRRAIDFFGDGDLDDFTMTGVSWVAISAGAGDDLIDGGDEGIDQIDGGAGNDVLWSGRSMSGGDGDDILIAGPLPAGFSDGPGDDISIGGPFTDQFFADQSSNGADQFIGGGGVDVVDYSRRTIAVQIALDGPARAENCRVACRSKATGSPRTSRTP